MPEQIAHLARSYLNEYGEGFIAPVLRDLDLLQARLIEEFLAELKGDSSAANFAEFARNLRLIHQTRVGLEIRWAAAKADPLNGF